MKLLAPGVGWARAGERLFWTENGGADWREIALPSKDEGIAGIFFLDTHRGWALLAGHESVPGKQDGEAQFDLASTADAGETWQTNHVTVPPQVMENPDRIFPELTGQGEIAFVDPVHGWMNLEGVGSADQGRLLVTSDGGRSWDQAPGDREEWASMVLVTAEEGWMVGGGGSNELYVTRDGAKSFEQVSLAAPAEVFPADTAVYALPTFEDRKHGFLPVTYSGGEKVESATVLFVTDNGGRTWKVDRILKNLESAQGAGAMPSAVVNSSWITVAVSTHRPTLTTLDAGARFNASIDSASRRSGYFQAHQLSFVTPTQGWVLTVYDELLSTNDGGAAWTDITPGAKPHVIQPQGSSAPGEPTDNLAASPPLDNLVVANTPALGQQISKHLGFHAYSTKSVDDMNTWWEFSPYFDIGIYLNGARGHIGHDDNLDNKAWLNAVTGQGWGVMPIWTGHQDPCADGLLNVSSFKTAQALYQVRLNAILASESATRAGIPRGSIIYYDLEPYHTSCVVKKTKVNGSLVAKALLNGWIGELHFLKRFEAGVYIGASNLNDFNQLQQTPDAVWVARFDVPPGTLAKPLGRVTIWDFTDEGLLDSQFVNDQRIHHYRSDTLETWGGVTINPPDGIDNDIEDALVVGGGGVKSYSFAQLKAFGGGSQQQVAPLGINNGQSPGTVGTIVGYLYDPSVGDFGFVYNYQNSGGFGVTSLDADGTQTTQLQAVNNVGLAVGYDSSGAFTFDTNSAALNELQYCGSDCVALGINDAGWIVGGINASQENSQGFVYKNGQMITLSVGAWAWSIISGINGLGTVTGDYSPDLNNVYGFIGDASQNAITVLQDSIVCPGGYTAMFPGGINNNGQVAGYSEGGGPADGFWFDPNNPNACQDLGPSFTGGEGVAYSLNDYAQIVGELEGTQSNIGVVLSGQ